ncbi:MAG: acyltransferase [Clostridiales bacterium]|nr:acyltransferase [Clostridiales bacterium]
MKYFLLFSGIELLTCLLGYSRRTGENNSWMSWNYTTAIKGASMMTILWSHVGLGYGVSGIQFIGTVGISLFIIFSGFGVQRSTESHGLKSYWRRRIVSVAIPYWLVEAIGLLITGRFTLKRYMLDFLFIEPAMGPGWFMQYIMICYVIYYVFSLIYEKKQTKQETIAGEIALYGVFLVWLVIDSLYFASPSMPFLRARQMLCFPFGITIAKHREKIATMFDQPVLILAGGIIGLGFMAVTQLRAIKESPFLIQNILSLFTVFPLALAVLGLTKRWGELLDNRAWRVIGLVSFEVYLIHIFTLGLLKTSVAAMSLFLGVTAAGTYLLYLFRRELKKWLT